MRLEARTYQFKTKLNKMNKTLNKHETATDVYTLLAACGGFSSGALVMLRLSTDYGYSNTWWRVMFCDSDGTFIGRLERHHWHEYTTHKKGEDVRWDSEKVQHIWSEGEQFCYGDNITICSCAGLCRNK